MRSTTPRKIIQIARIKTDQVYSAHTDDSEALLLLNQHYLQLYTQMVNLEEGLFLITADLTVTAGIASIPDNCQKIRSVFYTFGNQEIPVERKSIQDRNYWDASSVQFRNPSHYTLQGNQIVFESKASPANMKIKYIPHPVELSSLDDSIQLVANEDQYLIACLCKDMAKREESDTTPWEMDIQKALATMKSLITPRDDGSLPTVRDIYGREARHYRGVARRGPYR